jgi:regulator of protease activity HflC (stomatin/prohibitin superfamily)
LAIVIVIAVVVVLALLIAIAGLKTVDQAHVGVVTMFGKYRRTIPPGLNLVIPFFERIYSRVPVQNQTNQLEFAAITSDQAAVHFKATIIFSPKDHMPETIQLVAFKFITYKSFSVAMTSAVEAAVREFVATMKQAEILGLRTQIAHHAKENLNEQLASWGYALVDLAINDIAFDQEVMTSMSRIVAATNSKIAAENEGQALLITRTKQAEAEGAAIRISAENEATAAKLRGEGLANFRLALAQGFAESAALLDTSGVGTGVLALTLWTETIHDAVRDGKGNVIFLDGNLATMDEAMRRLQAMMVPQTRDGVAMHSNPPRNVTGEPTAQPFKNQISEQ